MLTATSDTFTRKHYAFLGKLFMQKEPVIAEKLISQFLPIVIPCETDFSKIRFLYNRFCEIEEIHPDQYIGPLHKSSKVIIRRRFISVILHLYCPQVFVQGAENFILMRGLTTHLSIVLRQSKNHMSMAIREVILWEKHYDDFSRAVALIIEKLKEDGIAN